MQRLRPEVLDQLIRRAKARAPELPEEIWELIEPPLRGWLVYQSWFVHEPCEEAVARYARRVASLSGHTGPTRLP